MSSSANDIISDFNFARSEAVKRRVPITLCKSQDGASCDADDTDPFNRWIIFVDDEDPAIVAATDGNGEIDGAEVILRDRELPESITVVTDADEIRAIFLPTGFPIIETENVNRFVLCDVRGNVTSAGGDSARERSKSCRPGGRRCSAPRLRSPLLETAHDPQPRQFSRTVPQPWIHAGRGDGRPDRPVRRPARHCRALRRNPACQPHFALPHAGREHGHRYRGPHAVQPQSRRMPTPAAVPATRRRAAMPSPSRTSRTG